MRGNKRFILLLLSFSLILGLVACGNNDNNSDQEVVEDNTTIETGEQAKIDESDNSVESDDNVISDEIIDLEVGKFEVVHGEENLDIHKESGPINLRIGELVLGNLKVDKNYQDLYGQEEVTMLILYMEVENTSESTVSIHPGQGILVTNTKEQVDADLFQSDDVGGDFIGEVVKDGGVLFMLDSDAEDIESFKYVVNGAVDDSLSKVGEDIVIEYELNK